MPKARDPKVSPPVERPLGSSRLLAGDEVDPTPALLQALRFASEKHRDQRRKDPFATPYVNHPIAVAELLAIVGRVTDPDALVAAILHDTVEDTDTRPEEIGRAFGPAVRGLVEELTDDKSLPKGERKRLQVEHAPHLSERARLLKIADLACNVRDVASAPPPDWSRERRAAYLDWAEAVVSGCRGASEPLERAFDEALERGRAALED